MPRLLVYLIPCLSVLLLSFLVFLIIWSRGIVLEAKAARSLRAEVMRLGQENMKIVLLEEKLTQLADAQERVRVWAGLPPLENGLAADSTAMLVGAPEEILRQMADPQGLSPTGPDARGTSGIREGWCWPVEGWISRAFSRGEGEAEAHFGVDIVAPQGTEVVAAASGEVEFAGWDDYLGNLVILRHVGGYSTSYGHNSDLLVSAGEIVAMGAPIARVGTTGRSSAPHLHFTLRYEGSPLDPKAFLEGGRTGLGSVQRMGQRSTEATRP